MASRVHSFSFLAKEPIAYGQLSIMQCVAGFSCIMKENIPTLKTTGLVILWPFLMMMIIIFFFLE